MSNGAPASTALMISDRTLVTLQNAAQIFPIPGIAVAASVALEILYVAQTAKSNKDSFIAIGRDSCIIVETVIGRVQMGPSGQLLGNPSMLRQDADMLLADMRYIQKCLKRVKKRSVIGRIFDHQMDQDILQECRERLTHAMSLFGLQTDTEIRRQLDNVSNQLAALLQFSRGTGLPPDSFSISPPPPPNVPRGGSDSRDERPSQEITVAVDENIISQRTRVDDSPPDGKNQYKVIMLLSAILRASDLRKALFNLQGYRGQLMVNYLHSLVLEPSLPMPWLRKHSLIALRELSKASLLYPHCYALKDIIFDSHESGGAFSDVHKGRYGEQLLCLKVVRLHQKSDTEAMLKIYVKEAILWGQLNHPNIVPFYGIYYLNEARRQVCLVSPWMRNGNLVEYLRGNTSAPRSLLIYDIAAGLEYLHSQSLVHSDIKGMNILVDDSERACITDFGLSFVRTDHTLAHTLAATTSQGLSYRWAAPELLEEDGTRATLTSDVWALGCVFYEVLTGLLPFCGSTDFQITRKLMNGASPAENIPVSSSDSIENAMWGLMSRCWTRDPSGRPTCQDVLNELKGMGLAREQEEIFEDEQKTRNFQRAMRKNEEVPLDLNAVEQILNELVSQV